MHNHSTRSDGLLSPTQLIELASRNAVDAIALTDHDTTDGLEEAAAAARTSRVVLVPGVEISVDWGGTTLHVDSQGNYINESAWGGSGGGISAYEGQPAYQRGIR